MTGRRVVVAREATSDDAGALAALRYRWQVVESGREGLAGDAYGEVLGQWMAEHALSHRAFVAESDGAAVAMAWLAAIERVPAPAELHRRAAMLQSVYVEPAHRNEGVGSALVAHVIDVARRSGFAYLMVHPSERSFPFYERLGFRAGGGELELRFDGR